MSPDAVVKQVYEQARRASARIALPDTDDERIAEAVRTISSEHLATPLLITADYFAKLSAADQATLINVLEQARAERGKPLPEGQARTLLETDTKYVAAAMVRAGLAEGYVAGNLSSTESTLRPALQIIGTEGYASSFFIMGLPDGRTLCFADCGFNVDPSAEQLAQIGIDTARSAASLGIDPKVAFLSFSTAGSAKHARVDKVRAAITKARELAPEIAISEEELQLDAALDPAVAAKKAPNTPVAGKATVLVFPDLDSGNIAYKLAHLLGARAIGPIMQGLKAPANDLSRGCSAQDIVDVVAITAMQAGAQKTRSLER